jgi:hypothetical protein
LKKARLQYLVGFCLVKIFARFIKYSFLGFQSWFLATESTAGSVESCVVILKNCNLLAISPGGVREMLFSDSNYGLIWGKRSGFAKIAIEAKVVSIVSLIFDI